MLVDVDDIDAVVVGSTDTEYDFDDSGEVFVAEEVVVVVVVVVDTRSEELEAELCCLSELQLGDCEGIMEDAESVAEPDTGGMDCFDVEGAALTTRTEEEEDGIDEGLLASVVVTSIVVVDSVALLIAVDTIVSVVGGAVTVCVLSEN